MLNKAFTALGNFLIWLLILITALVTNPQAIALLVAILVDAAFAWIISTMWNFWVHTQGAPHLSFGAAFTFIVIINVIGRAFRKR